jgi:hypothetical protein
VTLYDRKIVPDRERCSGVTWGGDRCAQRGSWKSGGKLYCKLHRPDRIKHAEHRKKVRERRDAAKSAMIRAAAAGRFDEAMKQARLYHEMLSRFDTMVSEARVKYGLHGRFIAKLPNGCPDCSRTDAHVHCPECGSTEHAAANCDLAG